MSKNITPNDIIINERTAWSKMSKDYCDSYIGRVSELIARSESDALLKILDSSLSVEPEYDLGKIVLCAIENPARPKTPLIDIFYDVEYMPIGSRAKNPKSKMGVIVFEDHNSYRMDSIQRFLNAKNLFHEKFFEKADLFIVSLAENKLSEIDCEISAKLLPHLEKNINIRSLIDIGQNGHFNEVCSPLTTTLLPLFSDVSSGDHWDALFDSIQEIDDECMNPEYDIVTAYRSMRLAEQNFHLRVGMMSFDSENRTKAHVKKFLKSWPGTLITEPLVGSYEPSRRHIDHLRYMKAVNNGVKF
jgi:hypothetical protein